ncbi:TonB-dependent receptor [uncultured Algibacter sp.]|uniref:SusC/RagA family TonB-linked outer membrane protein n=1 Tax=uncultured Algibacter sp. TaxID=298659 RepID=UPI00260425FE|nr:TonB-dependent receptor [uncultured Algibacter sp.]
MLIKLMICKYKLMFILFLSFGCLFAQNIKVKGAVTSDGIPLPGVNIVIKGTTTGVVTDFDGLYEIEVSPSGTLVYSYIGYITLEKPVGNKSTINVSLQEDLAQLDEVVVVGYGTQKKKEVTGAVVKISSETIEKLPVADVGAALQGQVAGVNVQSSSGRPGSSANVQIRGLGSLNSGALGPLYVVDGIPAQGNPNIAPEQIESIDVLKDGASAAIYGTRASNGVILITTKRGKVGNIKVDLNTYTGIQNITSFTPLMNTAQQLYADEVRQAANNDVPLTFIFNPNALNIDTDFVADVTNNNAPIKNINLNVNGGTDIIRVNLNTTYFEQDGVLINSGFNRLASRLTADFTKGKFKIFSTFGFTTEDREQEPFALYELAIVQMPFQPSINDIMPVGENSVSIPVRNAIQYSYLSSQLENVDERKVESTNAAINLDYEIFEGFNAKLNLGRNTYSYARKFFRPQYLVYDFSGDINPTASVPQALLNEDFIDTKRETLETILNYKKSFGDHNFNFTGVLSYERFESKTLGVGVIYDENSSNNIQTLGYGAEGIAPTSFLDNSTISGKLLRVQYNYKGKYLLSASYRRDGSSKFSEENRYGDFWGFSAGWNIHDEAFFQNSDALSFINNFKLRASWAELGNQSIPSYSFQPIIETGINYPFGPNESINFGQVQRRFVDPNIKWETTISKNIGIDLAFLNNQLTFTADVYQSDKKDMLLNERLTPSSGTYHPNGGNYDIKTINAGNMVNKGFELSLGYKNQTEGGFKYSITGVYTQNKNTVTDLNGVERGYGNGIPNVRGGGDFTTFLAEGYEAGAFFLVQSNGIIKDEATLAQYKQLDDSAQIGDMMYIDQNGNGEIDDNDRVYAGSGQSDFEGGLNFNFDYKGFDLFIQNYFSSGAEIYNGAKRYAYANARHRDSYHMWSPQNNTSDIPTDRLNAGHNNFRARSDFFLEDGSYWRIRNITLGYTIPGLEKTKIDKFRVYLTGVNPITFTKYTGYDPEVGGDGLFTRGVDRGDYPVTRQFMLGLQLGF